MKNRFANTIMLLAALTLPSAAFGKLAYIGTLDKKLLVFDEDKEEVVDEIQLGGIPRTTALSADQTKLHIFTTKMLLETVDLKTRKVISSFNISDGTSKPRIAAANRDRLNAGGGARFSGIAVDPGGRYLYTTMRLTVKEIDEYRIDPPQFVQIDLQDKKVSKVYQFPKDMDDGFGFNATYKVSPDGKLLYVFQEDILVFDLATFKQVDQIDLAQPPYPGASPYRLAASEDPNDTPQTVTSVFTAVDPVVHKGTLGLAKIDLEKRKVEYFPIGPSLPMIGFMLSPDRKRGYSVMPMVAAGGNRATEWWEWDLTSHKVIRKQEFQSPPTFRYAMSGDGKKFYLYGNGPTIEVWDAQSLTSRKLIDLKKDTTTNFITTSMSVTQ
jgi:DNA-binding beta-propeller fold protein YncE